MDRLPLSSTQAAATVENFKMYLLPPTPTAATVETSHILMKP